MLAKGTRNARIAVRWAMVMDDAIWDGSCTTTRAAPGRFVRSTPVTSISDSSQERSTSSTMTWRIESAIILARSRSVSVMVSRASTSLKNGSTSRLRIVTRSCCTERAIPSRNSADRLTDALCARCCQRSIDVTTPLENTAAEKQRASIGVTATVTNARGGAGVTSDGTSK